MGGKGADVYGYIVAAEERDAPGDGAVGEVFDQLVAYRRLCHDVGGCNDQLDLAANVGGVPARATPPGARTPG